MRWGSCRSSPQNTNCCAIQHMLSQLHQPLPHFALSAQTMMLTRNCESAAATLRMSVQLSGHLVDGNNKKVAGPTISGNFDGTLTAHLEDGSQRKLWQKQYPPTGPDRCTHCPAWKRVKHPSSPDFLQGDQRKWRSVSAASLSGGADM